MKTFLAVLLAGSAFAVNDGPLVLYSGYITKVRCEGKLLISAIGEPSLIALEALPAQVGCGVLLKPLGKAGRTNLALETSTGSVSLLVEVVAAPSHIGREMLSVNVRATE